MIPKNKENKVVKKFNRTSLNTFRIKLFLGRFLVFFFFCFFSANLVTAEDKTPVVKVGVFQLAPMVYIDDNGSPQGVFVDIIDAICAAEGWKVDYIKGTWNQGLERVKNGEIHLMTAVMHLARRESFLDFPKQATFNIWGQIYVDTDTIISGVFDMEGKTIGVLKGGANGENFVNLLTKLGIQGRFISFDSQENVAQAIKEKKVYAGVFTNVHGYNYQQTYQLKQTQVVFDPSFLKYATAEGTNQQLLKTIDSYLSTWKNDQTSPYHKIIEKYFGSSQNKEVPEWVWTIAIIGVSILGATILVVFFLMFFNKKLKKEVRSSTQKLVAELDRHKITEKELSLSERKLFTHLQNTPIGALSWDLNFKAIEWNPAAEAIFGYSKAEAMGKHATELILPKEQKEMVDGVYRDLISGKGGDHSTNENMTKGGRRIMCDWYNTILKDADGKVIGAASLVQDITERIRAEKAITDSEAYMQSIFRAAPTGIGVVHDRVIEQVNDRFCEMLGYSKDELIGQNSIFVYPSAEEFERVGQEKYKQIKESGTGTVETLLKCKDGKTIDVLLSSTPIIKNDLSGAVTFTALDISKLKKTERSLRDTHERFLTVLDSIDASVYVADMETYDILFMNKNLVKNLGKDSSGKKCWQVIGGGDRPCSHCSNTKLVDKKLNPTGVYTRQDQNPITGKWYIHHDRAIKWVDGRLVRLQIATDITEIKKMEEMIRDAQKMESIGNLAGGIAHDFNNILFPILGMSELLLEDLPNASLEYKNAKEILKAGKRGRELVKQILAFSRQSEHKMIPTRVQSILKEVLKLTRSTIPSNIKINQEIQTNCGLIMADPTQIHQVAMNIITNAYHAVEAEGGAITIRLKETQLENLDLPDTNFKPGKYAVLSISDTGYGISADLRDKIFDPYFTTKAQGKGTGLGLSVVYGIVKEHTGYITVLSDINKGTTFNVYFPLMKKTTETIIIDSSEELGTGQEKILLVDDEPSVARLEKQMLERLGYKVTMRVNSLEALEVIKKNPRYFDLVMSDMTMPYLTGDQLAAEIKSIRPDIPIIICTGFSDKINDKNANDFGIAGILMKPITKSDMAKKIRKILDEIKE